METYPKYNGIVSHIYWSNNMLKSYKQFFQEVELLPYFKKSNKLGTYVGDDFDNAVKRLERYAKGSGGLKHLEVSKLDKDHTLHHFNIDNSLRQHDFIVKHKGKVSHHIITTSHRDNVHHIDAVASSGESPIKAHDVYHHMLKRGNTLVSNAHTRGRRDEIKKGRGLPRWWGWLSQPKPHRGGRLEILPLVIKNPCREVAQKSTIYEQTPTQLKWLKEKWNTGRGSHCLPKLHVWREF